jgi:hypothetical protein
LNQTTAPSGIVVSAVAVVDTAVAAGATPPRSLGHTNC